MQDNSTDNSQVAKEFSRLIWRMNIQEQRQWVFIWNQLGSRVSLWVQLAVNIHIYIYHWCVLLGLICMCIVVLFCKYLVEPNLDRELQERYFKLAVISSCSRGLGLLESGNHRALASEKYGSGFWCGIFSSWVFVYIWVKTESVTWQVTCSVRRMRSTTGNRATRRTVKGFSAYICSTGLHARNVTPPFRQLHWRVDLIALANGMVFYADALS